jgi:hypothetical protein
MTHLVWPSVALLLGLFLIWILREPVRRLIDRITHIDKSGIKAASQETATKSVEAKHISSRDLMEVAFNAVIGHQESLLREQLARIQFNSDAEREALLLRALARSQVYAQFDRLSMLIYGSQLELLLEASSRPAGIDQALVEQRFNDAKAADSSFHEQTTLESYRAFLVNTNLLVVEGDRLRITPFGREFLKFLVDNSLTQRRRG